MNDEVGIHDGAVEVKCEGWIVPKIFVARVLVAGDRVSEKIKDAAEEYLQLFHDFPRYAYVSRLPSGIENGIEVNGAMLFQAEWMPPRMVAVGWVTPPLTPPQTKNTFGEGS